MDNSGRGDRPRSFPFPDVHPSTQKYFERLATRKKDYSLRCSAEDGNQATIDDASDSDGLVSDFDPFDILRLESLVLEDRDSPLVLPPLPLLPRPFAASATPQPQEDSSSAAETPQKPESATDNGEPIGQTPDSKYSPVEPHQTFPAPSRAEARPDALPVPDEAIGTIPSAIQLEIVPSLPIDQAQDHPAHCENGTSGTSNTQRCENKTEAPRVRDGGPVRNGRHVAWNHGGQHWQEEDEDEDGGAEKWQHPTNKATDQHTKKFACPFYKRYPNCSDLPKSCLNGWASVHRLKEHLHRCHCRTTYDCPRCFMRFASDVELTDHQRSQTRCEIASPCPLKNRMYMTQAQARALKKRKKNVAGEEKWMDLFRIIFPGAPAGNRLPNPFYEPPRDVSRETALLDSFCALLMDDLPPLLSRDSPLLSLANGVESVWSFSEILATRLPELKEAFLSRSASPGSNQDSSQSLSSQVPLAHNSTSMPHHPRSTIPHPPLREDGPVAPFPPHALLPRDRFSGSYPDFFLEGNSTGTSMPDLLFNNEGLQSDAVHFTQATTGNYTGDASLVCFQAESWTAGMELGQPGSITIPDHGDEEILL